MITRKTNSLNKPILTKENVESILPLSEVQEAFAWLRNHTSPDPGVLTAEITLEGDLDRTLFETAWSSEVQCHEMSRCSLRTPANKKTMLVVWKKLTQPVEFLDLSSLVDGARQAELSRLQNEAKEQLTIEHPPCSIVSVAKTSDVEHIVSWTFHHLMFDGWSTSIFVRNVIDRYNALRGGRIYSASVKPSLKEYLRCKTTLSNQRDTSEFWKEKLIGFSGNRRFRPSSPPEENLGATYSLQKNFGSRFSKLLNDFLQANNLTPNTVASACWSLVVEKIYNEKDVVFGTVVSGRNLAIAGIQNLVGLFANVSPVRIQNQPELTVQEWLATIRNERFESQPFENSSLAQVEDACSLDLGCTLLETLLVVENFPFSKSRDDHCLKMKRYRSGATSKFPITCYVIPGEQWSVRLELAANIVDEPTGNAMLKKFSEVAEKLCQFDTRNRLAAFCSELHDTDFEGIQFVRPNQGQSTIESQLDGRSETEIRIGAIWEQVLGRSPVDIDEDFFDLGGKSLSAIRILSMVEEAYGVRFAPTTLIENSTIRKLSKIVSGGKAPQKDAIIRFNRVEDGTPVVCIHVGGGHATYFRFLAKYMSDHPVVGLQPKGLEGGAPLKTFPKLAEYFVDQIEETFGKQRVHLVGYCMSAALCLELSRQLEMKDRLPLSLVIVDSGPRWQLTTQKLANFINGQKPAWRGTITFLIYRLRILLRPVKANVVFLAGHWFGNAAQRREAYRRRVDRTCKKAFLECEHPPTNANVLLIRSTEFMERPDKNFHEDWRNLTNGKFIMDVIEAEHNVILFEPTAAIVAERIKSNVD